jgi:hypothetical protein
VRRSPGATAKAKALVGGQRDLFPAYDMYLHQNEMYKALPPAQYLPGNRMPVKKLGPRALGLLGRALYRIKDTGYRTVAPPPRP